MYKEYMDRMMKDIESKTDDELYQMLLDHGLEPKANTISFNQKYLPTRNYTSDISHNSYYCDINKSMIQRAV